ncbi:hypothetical protein E2562_007318 [Oryza meyeriana var. granulata]|uniref:Uncharacterized protein n=1 Tax=Oryza meyeriana var. granulata TaxID=110450 RepID=A0A6G1CZF1_9ORYZ|nr:hypothetical protein E2562_007318 [Oryza meyeriana var. granulata]
MVATAALVADTPVATTVVAATAAMTDSSNHQAMARACCGHLFSIPGTGLCTCGRRQSDSPPTPVQGSSGHVPLAHLPLQVPW